MLKKNDLFDLIKSLTLSEQRYILSKANTKSGGDNDYALIIKEMLSMKKYSEDELKKKFRDHPFIKKTDVKKHFLFHWILRQLMAFHFNKYAVQNQLNEIDLLIEKSLYPIAYRLILSVIESFKVKEDYLSLLILLEKELSISRFISVIQAEKITEELQYYSKAYSDFQTFQSVKYKFRNRIDKYVFVRTADDLKKLEQIISGPIMDPDCPPMAVRNKFLYNLILYWFFASSNKWNQAYGFALQNFRLVTEPEYSEIDFTDEVVVAYYNILIASIVTENNTVVRRVLIRLSKLIMETKSERIQREAQFNYHLVQLIYANKRGEHENIKSIIAEAEKFITYNLHKFDKKRRNNFYFDLAKSYLIAHDYNKPSQILKNIIENTGEKENSIDFICFSKILYCLTCYERNEIEMMVYSARSASYFLRKYNSYFIFEKRILRFIRYELPNIQLLSHSDQVHCFSKLKEDVNVLFDNEYGKTVQIYFNFIKWIDGKIKNPLPATITVM
jgi:hypothetical protein